MDIYLTDEEVNELSLLRSVKNIKDYRNYLIYLKEKFNKLEKKEKNKFIKSFKKVLLNISFLYTEIFDKKEYYIYDSKDGLIFILYSQLLRINSINDFDGVLEELEEYGLSFKGKGKTKRISKKEVEDVFKTLYKLYPNLKNIFNSVTINIYLMDLENIEYNSITMPASTFMCFSVMCYYLKDDIEYQKLNNNHIYVFIHELGHVLSFIITKKFMQVPDKFLEAANLDKILTSDHPHAQELFADFFANTVMHQTKYSKYNVFESAFPIELVNRLDIYFKELIDNYAGDIYE